MLDNPIYNPTSPYKQKSQAAKAAEYQTVKGIKFVVKWIEIGVKSTIKLVADMFHQAFGR